MRFLDGDNLLNDSVVFVNTELVDGAPKEPKQESNVGEGQGDATCLRCINFVC